MKTVIALVVLALSLTACAELHVQTPAPTGDAGVGCPPWALSDGGAPAGGDAGPFGNLPAFQGCWSAEIPSTR